MRFLTTRRLSSALALLALALVFVAYPARAQEPGNRAGLIIEYGDGRVDTRCVAFSGDSISGTDLLLQSGIDVGMESSGMGVQVCQIGEVGCEPGREKCWCQCLSNPCFYWNYFQWKDGAWAYAPLGASGRQLQDGDVDAWVWGDGQSPPMTAPELACAAEAAATPAAPTSATGTVPPAAVSTAAPEGTASSPGFGCSSPALILVPLMLLSGLALWRR